MGHLLDRNREKLESELQRELDIFRANNTHSAAMQAWQKIKQLNKILRQEEDKLPPGSVSYYQHK